jgi:O-antigen/teichoic acid export membrane protein
LEKRNLKVRAINGFLWVTLDKFIIRLLQFVFGIIMARILEPADFGLVGMLTVFIGISQAFIDTGMSAGLIQKQNISDADISTVFIFNLVTSLVIYAVLFLAAPYVAQFYNQPSLTLLMRVLTLNLIISSFSMVQRTRLTINLDFKKHAWVNLLSVFTGGGSGILMAISGFGVWSLVGQTLIGVVVEVLVLWWISKGLPALTFARDSFRQLFGYGSKLLVAAVYARVMNEIYNLIAGKSFGVAELGMYTRARSFTQLVVDTINEVMNKVSFPVLSSLQNNPQHMVITCKRVLRMSAFVIIPVMVMLSSFSEPVVILLLTEKWRAVAPLLQWLVLARIFYPMSVLNLNMMKACGRSDWFMKTEFVKLPLIVAGLLITIPMGLQAMVVGQVVIGVVAFIINTWIPGRYFNFGAKAQFFEMAPFFAMAAATATVAVMIASLVQNLYLKLCIGFLTSGLIYLFLSYIFKVKELDELVWIAKHLLSRTK